MLTAHKGLHEDRLAARLVIKYHIFTTLAAVSKKWTQWHDFISCAFQAIHVLLHPILNDDLIWVINAYPVIESRATSLHF